MVSASIYSREGVSLEQHLVDRRGTAAERTSVLVVARRPTGSRPGTPSGSLALGGAGGNVSDDAGLRNVLLSGFEQLWVFIQLVPAPVDQRQTR